MKFSHDRNTVCYASPLAGRKQAPWSALRDIGHSHLLQADYMVVEGIGRIRCSRMLDGYEELGAGL